MWELVATAVQGLNAGAGLQAALAGAPSAASDSVSFARFAGRTRMLGLLLSTLATSACISAYYAESRGALWLAAAAGVGIGIPFNLLLMSPPTAVVSGSMRLEPYAPPSPRVRFAADDAAAAAAAPEGGLLQPEGAAAAEAGAGGSAFAAEADQPAVLSAATAGAEDPTSRRRRLMYSKSGMLVSPTDFATSQSKKYWFSAAMSLTAFACMMCMLATGKDAATFGYAPF